MDRFWQKVELAASGCWLWTASKTLDGYGHFKVGKAAPLAHRWLYEQLYGPIAAGMQCDHLCRVRHCVNPFHLEIVSQKVNISRGNVAMRFGSRTHCSRGHQYTGENTYILPRTGERRCRICSKMRDRKYKDTKRRGSG